MSDNLKTLGAVPGMNSLMLLKKGLNIAIARGAYDNMDDVAQLFAAVEDVRNNLTPKKDGILPEVTEEKPQPKTTRKNLKKS